MTNPAAALIRGYSWFAVIYFLVLNSWYLVLTLLAGAGAIRAARQKPFAGLEKIFRSPLVLPISVIVPARNEEPWIVDCVRGLLDLHYPQFEVIVVDDGSTDGTFALLERAYGLAEIPKVIPARIPTAGAVRSVHAPRGGEQLLVIRKESGRGPADAVNTGVNASRYPLVCRIDADTYLDADALLAVVAPVVEDPRHTVGVGASVRLANGSEIRAGRVVTPRMPGGLAAVEGVEYLRAYLLGRTGWAQLRGLLFLPGVFCLFRRDVFVEVGGLDAASDGDDVEFVTRLHHYLRRRRRRYQLRFVPDPCCWTQVPDSYRELARQRRRWAHILASALRQHRSMIGNPRYGFIGLVVLPYFLFFELVSAPVELLAIATFAVALSLGIGGIGLTLLFVAACFGYATLLSITSMAIEEFSYYRYRTWRDFGVAACAAIAENLGYRQLHAWWRLRGMVSALSGRRARWAPAPARTSGGAEDAEW